MRYEEEGNPEELLKIAATLAESGKLDRAIKLYHFIRHQYPDNSWIKERVDAQLGYLYLTLGQLDRSEDHLVAAISLCSTKARYHYLLGTVYLIRRDWPLAVSSYRKALDLEPWNSEYMSALGDALFNSGEKEGGIRYLREAIDNKLLSSRCEQLATAYLAVGDVKAAKKYAGKAISDRPDNVMAWAVLRKAFEVERGVNTERFN